MSLDGLDTAAVHVLRRLGRAEKVESTMFRRSANLQESRIALLNRGLVAETSTAKGRKQFFNITAAGRALLPAVAARDAEIDEANQKRAADEAIAARVRNAAPALLRALQDLVAASTDPDLSSPNDDTCAAAFARQDDATAAARKAIKIATVIA